MIESSQTVVFCLLQKEQKQGLFISDFQTQTHYTLDLICQGKGSLVHLSKLFYSYFIFH